MKKLFSFLIFIFIVNTFSVYGKPLQFTPEQREKVALYWSKLNTAVKKGDIDNINKYWALCLEKGVDPWGVVQNAQTVETIKALEKLGVDVTKRYSIVPYGIFPWRETMLECACLNGFPDVIEYLVKKDPTALNQRDEERGFFPHQIAIIGGWDAKNRYKIVKRLLALGAPVDGISRDGDTALMIAAYNGSVDIFTLLLDAGASDAIKNKKGKSVDDYIKEREKREGSEADAEAMKQAVAEKRASRAADGKTFQCQKTACATVNDKKHTVVLS